MNVVENLSKIKKNEVKNRAIITKPIVIGKEKINAARKEFTKNKFKSCITPINYNMNTNSSIAKTGSSSRSTDRSHVILALCEGRGQARAVVGIASIDINRPNLILCQIHDTQNYINTLTKINVLNPVEILMPSSQVDNPHGNRLFVAVKEHYIAKRSASITAVPRSVFNSNSGLHFVNKLCTQAFSSVILLVKQKFYALSSACALLNYLELENIIFSSNSIKVEYQEAENTTLIDIDTADRMELVSCQKEGVKYGSLLSILNHCCTNIGRRQLRADILQPPCTSAKVEARLDCVQELIEKPTLLSNLRMTLMKLSNIDQLLMFGTVVPQTNNNTSEKHLNYILLLKSKIGLVEPLVTELQETVHPTFQTLYQNIKNFPLKEISNLISCLIHDEAYPSKGQGGNFQRAFAIKSQANCLLDLTRKTYSEIIDDMRQYVEQLSTNYNLPLKVNYNAKKGYHIIMNISAGFKNMKSNDFPDVFIQVERLSNSFSMTTVDLVNFDRRIKNGLDEILSISNVLIRQLLLDLQEFIGNLYTLCDDIALLDVLQSLAQATMVGQSYVRPDFSLEYMKLTESRHPLVDCQPNANPIGNPVFASDYYNFHLITGPNMSGKSIYIRQIILIQIMAQVGCFVPAKRAVLRLANRIFARTGQGDDLEHNASSFVLEMKEMQYIFNCLTDKSLIIVDEVCRSTCFDEGVSIAYALSEKLLKTKAFTFFATHFLYLQKLSDDYLNVSIWQLETLEDTDIQRLRYTHRLKPGVTTIENYGIKLAKICAVSKTTVREAEKLLNELKLEKKIVYEISKEPTLKKLQYHLTAELKLLEIEGCLTSEILEEKIREFETKTGQLYQPIHPNTIQQNKHQIFPQNVNIIYDKIYETSKTDDNPNENENYSHINNNTIYSKSSKHIFDSLHSSHTKTTKTSIFADKLQSASSENKIFNNQFSTCPSSTILHTKTFSSFDNLNVNNQNFDENPNEQNEISSNDSNFRQNKTLRQNNYIFNGEENNVQNMNYNSIVISDNEPNFLKRINKKNIFSSSHKYQDKNVFFLEDFNPDINLFEDKNYNSNLSETYECQNLSDPNLEKNYFNFEQKSTNTNFAQEFYKQFDNKFKNVAPRNETITSNNLNPNINDDNLEESIDSSFYEEYNNQNENILSFVDVESDKKTYLTQMLRRTNLNSNKTYDNILNNEENVLEKRENSNETINEDLLLLENLEPIKKIRTDLKYFTPQVKYEKKITAGKIILPNSQKLISNQKTLFNNDKIEITKSKNINLFTTENTTSVLKNNTFLVQDNIDSFKKPQEKSFKNTTVSENISTKNLNLYLTNVSQTSEKGSEKEILNSTLGSNVDDFNFFLKYRPGATSTPILNTHSEKNDPNCTLFQKNQVGKTETSYESLIQENDNFLKQLDKKQDETFKESNINKSIKNISPKNSENLMNTPKIDEESEIKCGTQKKSQTSEKISVCQSYNYKKYIMSPKLILNCNNSSKLQIRSEIDKNNSSYISTVNLLTQKNSASLIANETIFERSYKTITGPSTISETIYEDAKSTNKITSDSFAQNNSLKCEENSFRDVKKAENIESNIDDDIKNLEKAIEDSDANSSLENKKKNNFTKTINQKNYSTILNEPIFKNITNLDAECSKGKEKNSFYSCYDNQLSKNISEKSVNVENKTIDEDKNLNSSLVSIFSNVDDQKFFSHLDKYPENMSTPKRVKKNHIYKTNDLSINNILLFSQTKPTTSNFDTFKSPNNIIRKPILNFSSSIDNSFKSATSIVPPESPILSNRTTMLQLKRKPESFFFADIKKSKGSDICKHATSRVIPTTKQIKNCEKLYVGKRDRDNTLVLKKVDEQKRKMKIRNVRSLLQKCLEQTVSDTMSSSRSEH